MTKEAWGEKAARTLAGRVVGALENRADLTKTEFDDLVDHVQDVCENVGDEEWGLWDDARTALTRNPLDKRFVRSVTERLSEIADGKVPYHFVKKAKYSEPEPEYLTGLVTLEIKYERGRHPKLWDWPSVIDAPDSSYVRVLGDVSNPTISEEVEEALRHYWKLRDPIHSDWLRAVVCNDLQTAVARADLRNRRQIVSVVLWMANNLPDAIYGSFERYNAHRDGRVVG